MDEAPSPPRQDALSSVPTQGSLLQKTYDQMRVVIITNIPSPYQVDLFNVLSRHPGVALSVLFCARGESDRHFKVPSHFPFHAKLLRSLRVPGTPKDWHWNVDLAAAMREFGPFDIAILSGSYFMPSVVAARFYLVRNSQRWYYWGENPFKKSRSKLVNFPKQLYLRRFLSSAYGVFGIGSLACDEFKKLAPPNCQILNIPYAPDLSLLTSPSPDLVAAATKLRASWGVASPCIILFAGSLIKRKAPDILLAAFEKASRINKHLCLVFAGAGPMEQRLRKNVATLRLTTRVRFQGFLHGDELLAQYLASDLFVLPTRTHEGWGVVVQEAMAAALPVIVSRRVGCAADLVQGKAVGVVTAHDNADELSQVILTLTDTPDVLKELGIRARREVLKWDSEHMGRKLGTFLVTETSNN